MTTLAPDEKSATVMVYTSDLLVRGEVITKTNIRVSTWLRTQGMPEYLHVLKPQVLVFGSGGIKTLAYQEIFVPTAMVLAFHLAPPAVDPMDYAEDEKNRALAQVIAHIGTFLFKGTLRVSAQTGLASSLEASRTAWLSIYQSEVTNPYLSQMPALQVPLALVNPKQISFAVSPSAS